jgi:D-alanyl-D-alanine carboxypeptidase
MRTTPSDLPGAPTPRFHRRRRWLSLLIAAAVMLALSAAPAAAHPEPGYGQADLERGLATLTEAGVTGVQARIITSDGEHIVATSGVADLDTGEPVDPGGHYRIGSNTKTFVATVVLQLVAEGKLSLDDTVSDHLPGVVQGNGNDGGAITIRHLLQHTSGIFNYVEALFAELTSPEAVEEARSTSTTAEEMVALALTQPPNFEPGTLWSYSNTGYLLAGMIIEAVTGNTWEHEVEQRIFKPLGLADTSIPGDDPTLPKPHARGYDAVEDGGELIDFTEFSHSWAGAAGAVISTTDDLSRFFRALLAGELLPPEQLAQMQSTVRQAAAAPVGSGYGLGLSKMPLTCGGESWSHGGDTLGYHSREGFSAGGQRSVALSLSSLPSDTDSILEVFAATEELIDEVLCSLD